MSMQHSKRMSISTSLLKMWRFARIYGPSRALFKAAGRLRRPVRLVWKTARTRDVAIIGCGQFAFSTIGYFLCKQFGARIAVCLDPSETAAASFAITYGVPQIATSFDAILQNPEVRFVYIASNHASHSDYAVRALRAGKTVYVEKPVSVSTEQFNRLRSEVSKSSGEIFAGYNRPYAGAIRKIVSELAEPKGALSLTCFVSGHLIGRDHWYRRPEEGTRICGNAGHWIDLFVHLLGRRSIPDHFEIALLPALPIEADDNFALNIRTSEGDLFSLVLSSRAEPFEGINETINLQWESLIAKIDDFRQVTMWREEKVKRWRFWPKDVGHKNAVLQPFSTTPLRSWKEVEISTLIMLRIAEMAKGGQQSASLSVSAHFPPVAHAEETS